MIEHRFVNNHQTLSEVLPVLAKEYRGITIDTVSHAHFDSPEACVRYLQDTYPSNRWYDCAHDPYVLKMADGITFDAAKYMCLNGWQEGAERAQRIRDKINVSHPNGPRLVRYDVAGAVPNVGRALAGNPLNMRRMASADLRKRPVLTLINHMGGHHGVEAECFINRAGVVTAIVDAIENAGYSLHLIGASLCIKQHFAHETAITLKEPGQSVDLGRLAFSLGHVAMFRHMVFSVRCADSFNAPLTESLGSTGDYAEAPSDVFVLPSMNEIAALFASESAAETDGLSYLIEALRQQGCPAFPATN